MDELYRYHRQMLLPGIGEVGQRRLRQSRVLVVGCGALGTMIIDALARAGVGMLRIVDRDIVEITNLQRQVLFDEEDVAQHMPKAVAAKARIHRINQEVEIEAFVEDFNFRNAERLAENIDLILDGLDNFETRYLLNDLAVMHGLAYIYGGAVGTSGMSMPILPHPDCQVGAGSRLKWTSEQATPCLRCVFPVPPPAGSSPTCDTAGVLGPAVATIAAYQVAQTIKLLTGNVDCLDRTLFSMDMWTNERRQFNVSAARDAGDCICCVQGRFEHLNGQASGDATSLCGRDAVQILPVATDGNSTSIDLKLLLARLAAHGSFNHNRFMLRGTFSHEKSDSGEPIELTLFPDGRAILKGVTDPQTARSLYARYVGV